MSKIVSIKKINKPKKLYNLHIKDNHNYFANGKLVSNCHTASAKSLTGIMEKCEYVPYRIGMTGSINDTQVHELTLTGLFGGIKKVVKTRELIDQNYLSDIKIKMLILKYENFKLASRKYQDEIDFLVENEKRNKFISKLGLSLEGNTLILYNLVERHGKVLYELIEKLNKTGKKVFFISGKMKGNERNEIRKYVEKEKKDCIIVASYGTFQQGINIVNLHNIIFAHPTKAKIRIIQSIGRGLRKNDEKSQCTLYDISDDLRKGKRLNFSYRHMLERLKLYKLEQFKYKVHKIGM